MVAFQPSLRDLWSLRLDPSAEALGYLQLSLWDSARSAEALGYRRLSLRDSRGIFDFRFLIFDWGRKAEIVNH